MVAEQLQSLGVSQSWQSIGMRVAESSKKMGDSLDRMLIMMKEINGKHDLVISMLEKMTGEKSIFKEEKVEDHVYYLTEENQIIGNNLAKISFEKFVGEDPEEWLQKAEKFLLILQVDDKKKMEIVKSYMEGKAYIWFYCFMNNHPNADWKLFSHEICKRFSNVNEEVVESMEKLEKEMDVEEEQHEVEIVGDVLQMKFRLGDWKRKHDDYTLWHMSKSGHEDPRLVQKELYISSQTNRLHLPPWLFTSLDELGEEEATKEDMEISVSHQAATWNSHNAKDNHLLNFGENVLSVDVEDDICFWAFKGKDQNLAQTGYILLENNYPGCIMHPDTYLNKVFVGTQEDSLQLWNVSTRKKYFEFKGCKSAICYCVSAPALDVVAIGCSYGKIHIHHIRYDEEVVTFTHSTRDSVTALSFNTDRQPLLATCDTSRVISVWNLEKRKLQSAIRASRDCNVVSLHFVI